MTTLAEVIMKQLDKMHPIGSYFCTESEKNPSTILGIGTWVQLKDRMLVGVGDAFVLGQVGGESSHVLTNAEMPSHSHTRGSMEITGTFLGRPHQLGQKAYGGAILDAWGAFSLGKGTASKIDDGNMENQGETPKSWNDDTITFAASNTWSGSTSSEGASSAHNNMPPYKAVYIWVRTA